MCDSCDTLDTRDTYGAPGTKTEIDIEELDRIGNKMMDREFPKPTDEDIVKFSPLLREILRDILDKPDIISKRELDLLKRKFKCSVKTSFLFHIYLELIKRSVIPYDKDVESRIRKTLQIKSVKSHSGIANITVFTSPYPTYTNKDGEIIKQSFSCDKNCFYCPNMPDLPRSYLLLEPAVLRAAKNKFDAVRQMHDRMNSLYMIGNDVFKLEVNILGGTFTSYPNPYREEFIRDIYYAANTFWEPDNLRERLSLNEEKQINETTRSRIVLVAVELRPDSITPDEIRFLRYLSITRLQMGIQHTDDAILDKINRKCTTAQTISAIEMLKRHGFKIDGHLMPNLPDSNPEMDRKMLIDEFCGLNKPIQRKNIKSKQSWWDWLMSVKSAPEEQWEYYDLAHPELAIDQYKIYPTAIVIYTEIEKWYKDGSYIPYDEKYLIDILLDFKSLVFPWTRINRIMRDFYEVNIFSKSGSNLNMRNELVDILAKEGKTCQCIRCREVKSKLWDGSYKMVIRKYNASNGDEYFISAESKDNQTLYGFVRLRLDNARAKVFPELNGCALLREAHVYSTVSDFGKKGNVQHKGLGTALMRRAEEIAIEQKYEKMAVIAAIGSRGFYYKIGYALDPGAGEYLMKKI